MCSCLGFRSWLGRAIWCIEESGNILIDLNIDCNVNGFSQHSICGFFLQYSSCKVWLKPYPHDLASKSTPSIQLDLSKKGSQNCFLHMDAVFLIRFASFLALILEEFLGAQLAKMELTEREYSSQTALQSGFTEFFKCLLQWPDTIKRSVRQR